MTRKHFEVIAANIRATFEQSTEEQKNAVRSLASDLASEFAGFNPNFNRSRFLGACGMAG
ncbi:MAG: hypothetical protein JRC86_00605 [Deltaproteobacteria bacterium]|nr:hypothetical protein [Deltaproteobacteria bacterium]